ncbi:hypothetical protein BOX15_Mlig016385g1, partial [Macrostomum lignano]
HCNRSLQLLSSCCQCQTISLRQFSQQLLYYSSTSRISSSINEWRIAFVLGKPGSGKGTQGQLLASRLGLHHLSAGELLRSELKRLSDTPTGQDIANRMLTGKIVPSEITCRLLLDNMAASAVSSGACNTAASFIIDGFPRNLDNWLGWQRCCPPDSVSNAADLRANLSVAGVLLFDVSDETCLSRCLERSGSVGVGCRADDNATTLAKRLQSYSADTEPVVEEFQRLGLLHRIDASGGVETVYQLAKLACEKMRL